MSELKQHEVRISWRGVQIMIGLLAFLSGVLLYLLISQWPARSTPDLSIDQTTLNLGEVAYDTTVEAAFTVRNVGGRPLHILDAQVIVREGCCPPKAEVTSTTIQPGGEAVVRTRFIMHDGMGGPHDFRLYLKTDDPDTPIAELVILSNWVP